MSDVPKLPGSTFSLLGLVPVVEDALPKDEHGKYDPTPRVLTIQPDIHLVAQWHAYWHETGHLILDDGGIDLPKKVEESICDVLGTYLTAAVLSGFLRVDETRPMKVTP